MNPDYAPENEMRRAEVVGTKVQFFRRNRTKVKKAWLSFWPGQYKTFLQAREAADRWVNEGIPPLSRKRAKTRPKARISIKQLQLPIIGEIKDYGHGHYAGI